MTRGRVYISGPMTGLPGFNFAAFDEAAAVLEAWGWEVENPAEKGIIDGWTWADYLRYDLARLVECDGVVLLPGWEASKGARLEHHVATELGMWIMYYIPMTLS